jgi:hypothetical protein
MLTGPPVAELPVVITMLPPVPVAIDVPPATMLTSPPWSPAADPDPMYTDPLVPDVLVPVLNISLPLAPFVPALAVLIVMAPLVVCVPEPLAMLTRPPVPAVWAPPLTDTFPPVPEAPRPTVTEMSPLGPPVAAPVLNVAEPLVPLLEEPTTTEPLAAVEEVPDRMLTAPPAPAVPSPP